jgi:hypothetical protein
MKHFALFPHKLILSFLLCSSVLVSVLLIGTPAAHAGCGCTKPAPLPAAVRPNVTYGGEPVTLFHASLVHGGSYIVKFTAMNGSSVSVAAAAVNRRDLSDAVYKNQLVVPVPTSLPLGPVGITVTQAGQTAPFLSIPDTAFTLAPPPIVVPNQVGTYSYQNYQAAVGRDGRTYISLDITGISMARTFKAQAKGWPLRFTKDNTVFYNVQGFLMQLAGAPIPGLFSINSGTATDSDIAQYARHEFNTYLVQHAEHLPHAVDPTDADWHQDGTRHIDHDHLILTIAGTVNGAAPAAGATPAFTLHLDALSFFQHGLVGINAISMSGTTLTGSYNARTGLSGNRGDVLSNGGLSMSNSATINGTTTATSFSVSGSSQITGTRITPPRPTSFLAVSVPVGLTDLGTIKLSNGNTRTLGPGSYKVTDVSLSGGTLVIDNAAGPVTLYVTGQFTISGGQVTMTDPNPEKFAMYIASTKQAAVNSKGTFAGVIYAPQSVVTLTGSGQFLGSFVGQQMKLTGSAKVHYDPALRGE